MNRSFPGIQAVRGRLLRQHGQLQGLWRHQVHSQVQRGGGGEDPQGQRRLEEGPRRDGQAVDDGQDSHVLPGQGDRVPRVQGQGGQINHELMNQRE